MACLKFALGLQELKWFMVRMSHCFFSQHIMSSLANCFNNGVLLFVISRIVEDYVI